ncbi:MAG: ABC transporter permease [Moorea sp. SIO3C2]|nr:ABC transporter permease [Moorena sp. SIO3C2]
MDRILAQCIKELAQFRRDRLGAALVFLLPLMTMLIFGFAIRLEIKDVPLAVRDFDNSPLSRAYIEQVFATNQFKPVAATTTDGIDLLDRGIAQAIVVIPPDFSRQLKKGKTNAMQVLIDGTDVNNARVIQNSLRATTQFFLEKQGFQNQRPDVVAHIRIWFNPGRRESLYIVPGVYAIVLFTYPALVAAIAVVREKEQGTLVQVKASGISAWEFLLGKALAYVLIAIGEAVLLMGLGGLLFDLWPVANPWPLLVGTGLFLMVSVVYGLLVGVYSKQALVAVQSVMNTGLLAAVWLSGFLYPVKNIPWPLSLVANIVAARYYIELTRDAFLVGAGWLRIGHVIPILFLLTIGMFMLSWWRIRQR